MNLEKWSSSNTTLPVDDIEQETAVRPRNVGALTVIGHETYAGGTDKRKNLVKMAAIVSKAMATRSVEVRWGDGRGRTNDVRLSGGRGLSGFPFGAAGRSGVGSAVLRCLRTLIL